MIAGSPQPSPNGAPTSSSGPRLPNISGGPVPRGRRPVILTGFGTSHPASPLQKYTQKKYLNNGH